MRASHTTFLVLIFLSGTAAAQDLFKKPQRSGYFFFAPGAISVNVPIWRTPTYEIGGGFEGFLYKGFGLGLDLGSITLVNDQAAKSRTGIGCVYATYDFQRSISQRFAPFLVAGITIAPEFSVEGGYHLGGGVKYWFAKHFGLRLEFRDHARPGNLHTYNDVQALIGIAIR
jgi:hypothetical protein